MPIPDGLLKKLLALQVPKDVSLSPDGQEVVYTTSLSWAPRKGPDARSTLWLAETGKEKSARQLTSGLFCDVTPVWSPTSDAVAFVSDRAKAGERSAIYLLSLKGGEGLPLTTLENEQGISKLKFSPDGAKIAYLSADEKTAKKKKQVEEKDDPQVWGEDWPFARLRVLDVASKEVKVVVAGDFHVLDFDWSVDGKELVCTTTARPDFESTLLTGTTFWIVEVESGEKKEKFKFPTEATNPVWSGDEVYYVGPAAKVRISSGNCVYKTSLTDAEAAFTKIAHGDEDCAVALLKVGKDVAVRVQHGLTDKVCLVTGEVLFEDKKDFKSWHAVTDSKTTNLALALGSINHPTEVFTLSPSTSALTQLSSHGSPLADYTFGQITYLSTPSTDNKETLDGLFVTPATSPSKPSKTAVIIHGGPYYHTTDGFDTQYFYWTPALLAAGYAVLMPNYRGGSGRGERFAAYAVGGIGIYDEADVVALTQHAIAEGLADKENLVVGGYSQGGHLTYLSAVRNGLHGLGWRFKGAIAGAGVTDWAAVGLSSDAGAFETELIGRSPWAADKSDVSDRQGSAIWEMKRAVQKGGVIPPMLILHGEKDVRVPLEQAQGFRRGLEAAGLPYEYVVYPREDHSFTEQGHVRDMVERIVRSVDRWLG